MTYDSGSELIFTSKPVVTHIAQRVHQSVSRTQWHMQYWRVHQVIMVLLCTDEIDPTIPVTPSDNDLKKIQKMLHGPFALPIRQCLKPHYVLLSLVGTY